MPRALVIALVFAVLPVSGAHGQDATWLEAPNPKSWIVEGASAEAQSGIITIRKGPGWVRHRPVLADFVLKMDIRLVGPTSTANVYVRGWPTFDKAGSIPNNAYGVIIKSHLPQGALAEDADAWQHLEIECLGGKMVARVDGAVLYTREGVLNPQGYIALAVSSGIAEFRAISVERKGSRGPTSIGDAVVMGPGIEPPRPMKEAKPQYTSGAMGARIQGSVLLAAVVKADGTVGQVEVLQSLDPTHGLDRAARAAAAQWRFAPATKDGRPIDVVVTISLSFFTGRSPTERTL